MLVRLDENKVGNVIEMQIHEPSLDQGVSAYISQHKCWEPFETSIFRELMQGASSFIDVGANIGYYSLVASGLMKDEGTILSIEPEQNNYSLLVDNAKINNFTNIIPVNVGCLESDAGATILLSRDNYGDHRLIECVPDSGINAVTETTTLDKLISDLGKIPDLIKVDTQGSELAILKGMRNTLSDDADNICMLVEFWPYGISSRGESAAEFLDYLSQYQLNMCAIFEEPGLVIGCTIDDLRRWSTTIMHEKSMRYINLLLWGDKRKLIQNLFERLDANNIVGAGSQPSILNAHSLNPALVPMGWSFPEQQGVWSDGEFSEIIIQCKSSQKGWGYLQLEVYPFICEGIGQEIAISINGIQAGLFSLKETAFTTVTVDLNGLLESDCRKLVVGIHTLTAATPLSCALSNDSRELGIFLKNFALLEND